MAGNESIHLSFRGERTNCGGLRSSSNKCLFLVGEGARRSSIIVHRVWGTWIGRFAHADTHSPCRVKPCLHSVYACIPPSANGLHSVLGVVDSTVWDGAACHAPDYCSSELKRPPEVMLRQNATQRDVVLAIPAKFTVPFLRSE